MTDGLIHIPDALPVLSIGNHRPGTGKACIMDAVSIISGRPAEQDQPSCVHRLLRPLFITLNDSATDEQRPKLWQPALRAMGTGVDLDFRQQQDLALALMLAQVRRELSGKRLADHPAAAAVLRPLLAWQKQRTYSTRRAVVHADVPRLGCCRGCTLLATGSQWIFCAGLTLTWLYDGAPSWDDKLRVLGEVLDDWLVMLPTRDADQPADVPWGELRDQLGVVVPDDARHAAAMAPAAPQPEWSDAQ